MTTTQENLELKKLKELYHKTIKIFGPPGTGKTHTLIEKVFQETFPEWESGIIVGGSPESPTSRGDFCKEMSEYSNSDYFVIDDSHHEYKIREGLIEVDGNCGYVYRDHRKIIETWSE